MADTTSFVPSLPTYPLDDWGSVSIIYFFGLPWAPPIPPVPPVDPPPPTPGIGDPQWSYEQLSATVETFLGYRPTADELEGFPFEIYQFIIRSLRDRDKAGTLLLKRFLEGPQETWYSLYRAAGKLETLFDPEEVDAEYLPSLRRLVGFGDDLIDIETAASELELRRIIAGAIRFWKKRFLESGVSAAIRLVTGNRFKVRNWFDFRFIAGESMTTEDLENNDSNIVSHKTRNFFRQGDEGITRFTSDPDTFHAIGHLPSADDIGGYIVIINDTGSPSNNGFYEIVAIDLAQEIWYIRTYFPRGQFPTEWFIAFKNDEFLTEVRVVDEGSGQGELNRVLLRKLLELQRPHGERINVVYVDFLDLFTTENDFGQWNDLGYDAYTYSVADGVLTLATTATLAGITTNRSTASDWVNYEWKTKAALKSNGTFRCAFYDGWFWLAVSYSGFGTGTFRLYQNPASPTLIDGPYSFPSLNLDTHWTYTVEVYNLPSGDVNIKVLVDGNKIFDVDVASTQLKGNIQYLVETDTTVEIAETELWQYPLDIERIGPNP